MVSQSRGRIDERTERLAEIKRMFHGDLCDYNKSEEWKR
jgi:hypothetical protein